ncbi:MAG TPA: carbohydrate ABC transporter permease [Spirochaetia bacterium]|nr:carbohydrate ABC transporter permease [Spirochaetia bacterium]
MARFEERGPRLPVAQATRVDKVHPRARTVRVLVALVSVVMALVMLLPVGVMVISAMKTRADVMSSPPKIFFKPTLEGLVLLLTDRAQLSEEDQTKMQALADQGKLGLFARIALSTGMEITGPSAYVTRLKNSVIIAGTSTVASVVLGLFAAYAFSRFAMRGKNDLLFFILSTRMLPAVVVTIPLFLMYRQLGLHDRHLGMIILYTVFNLSFSVWLLKGFIDEIPKEYEEAALVDGYTRMQAFFRIVLPQAVSGIAATVVFCLIFAWNEYAFALMLTSQRARTAPVGIATMMGRGGIEWSAIAAGAVGFLVPVVIITFALRKYLLRGITFGAIRG